MEEKRRKDEEEARKAQEEKQQSIQEEDERRRRQAEEAQDEAKAPEDVDERRETREEERDGGEEAGIANTSSTAPASLRSPTSPNPSFSSLQARPTPPASSIISSPTPSVLSGQPFTLPVSSAEGDVAKTADAEQLGTSAGTITVEAEGSGPKAGDDPLVPPPLSLDATIKQRRGPVQPPKEEPGFFPAALTKSGDASLLLNADAPRSREGAAEDGGNSGDADSDGYGQPSPRGEGTSKPFGSSVGAREDDAHAERDQEEVSGPPGAETESNAMQKSLSVQSGIGSTGSGQKARPSFQIKVGDPQKVGDPVTAHIVYTVRTKVSRCTSRCYVVT